MTPTMLDSGTISPAELILTDITLPAITLLCPQFFVVGFEMMQMGQHLLGHSSELDDAKIYQHHRDHHHFPQYNFGLLAEFDTKFQTVRTYKEN
jgi:sterol desaturase/sphingolipid hydroxylase (fatty acid hydroxylase superfamily)